MRRATLLLVLVVGLAWGAAPPPRETPERLLMRRQALELNQTAGRLYGEVKPLEALKAMVASLRGFQKLYPPELFPDGHPDLATSLNNVGYLLQTLGAPDRALPYYEQALAMRQKLYPASRYKDGHPHLAGSLNNMGFVLEAMGEPARALEYFQQALAVYQKLYPASRHKDGHPDLALSLNNIGYALKKMGEPARALEYFQQALEMNQKLYPASRYKDGHPDLTLSLLNLGRVLQAMGEPGRALEYFQQALEMNQKLYPASRYKDGHPDLGGSLSNLGRVLQEMGEPARALEYHQQVLAMGQKLYPSSRFKDGHPYLATSLSDLGRVLKAMGEPARALEYHQKALAMYQKLYPSSRFKDGHPDLAISLNDLGRALQEMGEPARALEYHQKALAMYQKFYPASRYKDGHPDLARSLISMGFVLKVMGEPARALEYYQKALAMNQKLYPASRYKDGHPDLVASLHHLGFVLQTLGEAGKALNYLKQALEMNQRLTVQLTLSASESRALNHAASLPYPRDAYLNVSRVMAGHDSYSLIWQGKATISRIMERRHQAALAASTPQARDAFALLVSLRSQRQDLILAPAVKDTEHRDKRLRELELEIETAERNLLRLMPELEQQQRQATSRPEQLQKALPDGSVFIDLLRYIHTETLDKGKRTKYTPSYVGFVVRRDNVIRVELGEAMPIEEAIQQWRQAISEGNEGTRQAQLLRRLVWEPLAKHLPAKTKVVYLAPDMALSRLPFSALPNGKGGVLLQEHSLCSVPHGIFLLGALSRKSVPSKGKPTLLALGAVSYDEVPAKETLVADLRSAPLKGKLVWDALPGTRLEMDRLSKQATGFEVRTLSGKQATVANLMKELPRTAHAHLATHGFFADSSFRSFLQLDEKLFAQRLDRLGDVLERVGTGAGNPMLLSGLVCAGANRTETPQRGILTADAVSQLDLRNLKLAVLSACETGLGETAGGEGVFGLQRAFHVAGAHHVIASLWQVPDQSTAALMNLFYRNLWQQKLTPLEAMRQAQLAVYLAPEHIPEWARDRGPRTDRILEGSTLPKGVKPKRTAPLKHWAAFVVSGSAQ